MNVVSAAAVAIRRSTRPVAEILSDVARRGEINLPEACGYREVATAAGPILVEDGYAHYQPDRDLIDVALSVASAIEVDGTYRVTAVGIAADLPPVWVGASTGTHAAVAIDNLSACTSIHATPRAGHTHRTQASTSCWVVPSGRAGDRSFVDVEGSMTAGVLTGRCPISGHVGDQVRRRAQA